MWDGISLWGAAKVIIFSGIMNAEWLRVVLEAGLLPFIQEKFSDGHRLYQDNDLKHASEYIEDFLKKTMLIGGLPPESPDLNPIKLVWGSMKNYLRTHYKPRNLEELKAGIEQFWVSLTPEVCGRYIRHLNKVIPKIVEVQGDPSGY